MKFNFKKIGSIIASSVMLASTIGFAAAANYPAPFVKLWLHNAFVRINKEKMSKSLGNFVTIRDVLLLHDAEVIRYLLLASHYRSALIYTDDVLKQTRQSLVRLYTALRFLPAAPAEENSI